MGRKSCSSTKILNSKTGRYVLKNSTLGKKIIKTEEREKLVRGFDKAMDFYSSKPKRSRKSRSKRSRKSQKINKK